MTGGIKSSGKISVWFHVWCEISAVDVFYHLRRFRTRLMIANPILSIAILNKILMQKNIVIRTCYEDYAVQSKLFKKMEQELFKRLGIDPIKLKNQELLTAFAKKYFDRVKTEYSPKWLGQQRFDIFIPSQKTAIEYQGQQHYEAIAFFGGEKGFQDTVSRDKNKLELSQRNGVKLLYWKYTTDINDATFQEFREKNKLL